MERSEVFEAVPRGAVPRRAAWLLLAGVLTGLLACLAAVHEAYGPYDTNQCYWTWVEDGYGGYEQLRCWNPTLSGYYHYSQGGSFVRRYPSWYRGQRVMVAPPSVGLIQPRGVVVVPPPAGPMPFARPSPMGPVPQAVPSPMGPVPQAVPSPR